MLIQLYSTAVSFVATTANSNLDPILKTQKRIIRNYIFKYASASDYMVANELPTVYEHHVYELEVHCQIDSL